MADAYWMYGGDGTQQPAVLHPPMTKRPHPELEMPRSQDISSYYANGNNNAGQQVIRDIDSVNASYERYLRIAQISSYGGDPARSMTSGLGGRHHGDPHVLALEASDLVAAAKGPPIGVRRRPEIQLPPDATSTLFVEGLPANCTRREVSHIFRPFVGYEEVRLVTKESRHSGGDPLVLCFVDFQSPAHSATVMDTLQGYKFDEHDCDSAHLRLQFARNPGARTGGGHRGRR